MRSGTGTHFCGCQPELLTHGFDALPLQAAQPCTAALGAPIENYNVTAAEKLITKDAALFTALFEANPYSHEAVRNFRSFLNLAVGGDVDLLVRRAEAWWTAETAKKDNP